MILFTATLLFFPWTAADRYFLPSPFCVSPEGLGIYPDYWTRPNFTRNWIIAWVVWIWLAMMYVGFMFVLKSPRK